MTAKSMPPPPGDYVLHPKPGRTYRPQERAAHNGSTPRAAKDNPPRRGFPPRSEALASPLSEHQRQEVEDKLNKLPIMGRLGARFDLAGDPLAVCVRIDDVEDYHLGGLGSTAMNGAAISAIVDCAVGAAGVVHFPGVRSGTVNLAISFVRPLFGRTARACCWVVRRTNLLLFAEAAVLDSSNRVCATASGMVARVLPRTGARASGPNRGNGDGAGTDPRSSDSGAGAV